MESPRFRRGFARSAWTLGLAAVLAAVTCVGPNPVSRADPQATGSLGNFPFPDPLDRAIKKLKDTSETPPGPHAKKRLILQTAEDNLPKHFTSHARVKGLKHPSEYRFTTSQKPDYFSKPFNNRPVTVNGVSAIYYDYQAGNQLWADFANHKLGGGVFGNGMVQEETMALSMPQLADAAAIGYDTRTDTGHAGPLNSDPTPMVFTNIQRTIELDRSLYKDGWKSQSLDQIKSHLTPQHPNQNVNVLAVAVEKVEGVTQQFELATMEDLFNTFVAAYTLAKVEMPGATINTGPIGTGDFNNDAETVYVMQKLALQQIGGLTVNYWGLPSTTHYDNKVNQIISKWTTLGDNSVNSLVKVAHACLTAQCN